MAEAVARAGDAARGRVARRPPGPRRATAGTKPTTPGPTTWSWRSPRRERRAGRSWRPTTTPASSATSARRPGPSRRARRRRSAGRAAVRHVRARSRCCRCWPAAPDWCMPDRFEAAAGGGPDRPPSGHPHQRLRRHAARPRSPPARVAGLDSAPGAKACSPSSPTRVGPSVDAAEAVGAADRRLRLVGDVRAAGPPADRRAGRRPGPQRRDAGGRDDGRAHGRSGHRRGAGRRASRGSCSSTARACSASTWATPRPPARRSPTTAGCAPATSGSCEPDGRSFVYVARLGDALRLAGFLTDPVEIERRLLAASRACAAAQVVGRGRPERRRRGRRLRHRRRMTRPTEDELIRTAAPAWPTTRCRGAWCWSSRSRPSTAPTA